MLSSGLKNELKFKWVINDIWFGSAENMKFIKQEGKDFIMPLKTNRTIARSLEDKNNEKYLPIEWLKLAPRDCLEVFMEKIPFAVTLSKEEYVN